MEQTLSSKQPDKLIEPQLPPTSRLTDDDLKPIRKRSLLADLPHMVYRRLSIMLAERMGKNSRTHLNFNWITPQLAMGGKFPTEAAEHLAKDLGITHIVDVRVEERDDEHTLREHGITLLHLPTQDAYAVSQTMLDDGVSWINEQLAHDAKVYIHCQYGIGRSALLLCCVLVSMGYTPSAALHLAKQGRAQVAPNQEQLDALIEWAHRWREKQGEQGPSETGSDLADIAYSERATLAPES